MSTRSGEFTPLKEVMDEVGVDACRYFFMLRRADSPLDFDLELAKKEGVENPVYYVQYCHARIASIFKKAAEHGVAVPTFADVDIAAPESAGGTVVGQAGGHLARVLGGDGPRLGTAPLDRLPAGSGRDLPQLLQQTSCHLRRPRDDEGAVSLGQGHSGGCPQCLGGVGDSCPEGDVMRDYKETCRKVGRGDKNAARSRGSSVLWGG